jgi:hypothetical protein
MDKFFQLYLLERKFADANPILHQTGPMIEAWVQTNTHQTESVAKQQKEYLQIYFLVLQVSFANINEPLL